MEASGKSYRDSTVSRTLTFKRSYLSFLVAGCDFSFRETRNTSNNSLEGSGRHKQHWDNN